MAKIKVLCLSIWYPLTMSRYFEKAFRHRDDVDLKTVGPYTANWIPWLGGINVPMKYALPPDIPLPFPPNIGQINYEVASSQLPEGWIPDIVLCIDAGISWKYKPSQGIVVHVATDPHALNYDHPRSYSDKFFNMQKVYSKSGDIYLPYAYSKYDFYPEDNHKLVGTSLPDGMIGIRDEVVPKDTDAVLIGMPYDNRVQWVNELKNRGVSVIFENGPIFDEARALYNRGRIGLNWSSLDDLNCRAFELPALKICPVMNRVTDLGEFFIEDMHYLGFSNLNEAIEKVMWAKENPEQAQWIANRAYNVATKDDYTYDKRVEQILKECEFI